jgi:hypothetical protein
MNIAMKNNKESGKAWFTNTMIHKTIALLIIIWTGLVPVQAQMVEYTIMVVWSGSRG